MGEDVRVSNADGQHRLYLLPGFLVFLVGVERPSVRVQGIDVAAAAKRRWLVRT
jgi:hypothetical protein